jgi:hypothetical protein
VPAFEAWKLDVDQNAVAALTHAEKFADAHAKQYQLAAGQ